MFKTPFLFSLALCLASCEAQPVQAKGDVFAFFVYGPINQQFYDDVSLRLTEAGDRPIQMIVKSSGGDVRHAMAIGRLLADKDVEIAVEEYCFSACAQILLPAADRILVRQNASIAFHTYIANRIGPADEDEDSRESLRARSAEEKEYLEERGLNYHKLIEFGQTVNLFCVERSDSQRADSKYIYYTTFGYFIPSKDILMALGYPTIWGYWPKDVEQMASDFYRQPFTRRDPLLPINTMSPPLPPKRDYTPYCTPELIAEHAPRRADASVLIEPADD